MTDTTLHCLALRTVRHSDRRDILTAWSRERGRIAIAMPAGASREARRRRALSAPLALFEGEVMGDPSREIASMRDFCVSPGSPALQPSPLRAMIAAFIAEVLDHALRRTEADAPMSDYLFTGARILGAMPAQNLPMFAPVFLFGLLHFAGVAPDLDGYRRGAVFDLRDARFRSSAPLHSDYLEGDACRALMALSRVHYNTLLYSDNATPQSDDTPPHSGIALPDHNDTPGQHVVRTESPGQHFTRTESLGRPFRPALAARREILNRLIDYYNIHVCPLDTLKSLAVLQEMANF